MEDRKHIVDQIHKDAAPDPASPVPQPFRSSIWASEGARKDINSATTHTTTPTSAISNYSSSSLSAPTSPPASPLSGANDAVADYYSARPRHDKLGNLIPDRRRPTGAMASVYGKGPVKLPGDLGSKDPRRPKSPAPSALPGDLGPSDPRRSRSTNNSPAPAGDHHRHISLEGSESNLPLHEDPPASGREHPDSDGDADADADNDNDTDLDDNARGRERKRPEPGRTTSGKAINLRSGSTDSNFDPPYKPDPTKGQSKFSLAKDPKIQVTPPVEKKRIHPSTAFDAAPPSGISTPLAGSDDESHSELRAAQKLSLNISPVHSTASAHRAIRQVIRGDYAYFQQQAEEGRKRQRVYLVATDMSPESQYALEWTIGTVLRDGDTLLGVYAMDEESGSAGGGGGGGGVEIGKGADSVRDTAAIVHGLPSTSVSATGTGPSPLSGGDTRSASRGVPASPADAERRRAAEEVTQRCIHLLRKTRLQVRVVVEVFHCKSPRHMITEVIDFIMPTLVIIGSRGRSAVKGVLLGSFSNYLVTKSSVPVMVARKKLRKHSKSGGGVRNKDGTTVPYSGSGRTGRFSNVIEAPRGKGLRVKGWGEVGID
ncbi:hypothetical protein LTR53_005732 [Teratosphaeriaceae sp. CCFEE 6253]|nr:hypothetical protein LTR53_005732 [Teratosphaeriaceae sp. CCFEE 6253]